MKSIELKHSLLTVFSLLWIAACKTAAPTVSSNTTNSQDSTGTGALQEYRATYDQSVDLLHTDLDVRPDWEKKYLYGTARIRMKPHYNPVDTVSVNARGMTILNVGLERKDRQEDSVRYSYDGKMLRVPLYGKASRTDTITVEVR